MMEEEMKLISEKINKQEGRKYPCSNQIVVCGFFSTDEDWNNFVNNNLDKIKIRQKDRVIFANKEKWYYFDYTDSSQRGFRFYKIKVSRRVPRYSKFEQIFSAGFDDIIEDGYRFKYSINEIPKSLIKLCRKYPIKLSNNTVKYYKENQDAHYIAYNLDYLSLDFDDIYIAWNTDIWDRVDGVCIYYSFFNKLVNEYGYNAKDLWLYLDRIKTFEAVEDMGFLIRELYDYAYMMSQLSPKYDKYPRHFLTTHKIACRNYNRMKKEFSEELFKKRINKQYECSFGDYIFIYPDSTQDIKDEAVSQNNCVASYIDKVIDGKCHILFLRKKNKPDESLVTIEVRNNHIVQARRRFNDDVTAEDQKAIDAFNKKFANKEDKAA